MVDPLCYVASLLWISFFICRFVHAGGLPRALVSRSPLVPVRVFCRVLLLALPRVVSPACAAAGCACSLAPAPPVLLCGHLRLSRLCRLPSLWFLVLRFPRALDARLGISATGDEVAGVAIAAPSQGSAHFASPLDKFSTFGISSPKCNKTAVRRFIASP